MIPEVSVPSILAIVFRSPSYFVDLTGELARRLDEIIQRGIVGSKPEAIRQALIEYFNKLDEQQLRRARLRFLEEKGSTSACDARSDQGKRGHTRDRQDSLPTLRNTLRGEIEPQPSVRSTTLEGSRLTVCTQKRRCSKKRRLDRVRTREQQRHCVCESTECSHRLDKVFDRSLL
jgi:Arc/MetJ-type ribon-helix-helix transcriptional regulator